jgi:uncharacterized Zn ribbon protein
MARSILLSFSASSYPEQYERATQVPKVQFRIHYIDCKIDGFGAMGLKTEFVREV